MFAKSVLFWYIYFLDIKLFISLKKRSVNRRGLTAALKVNIKE